MREQTLQMQINVLKSEHTRLIMNNDFKRADEVMSEIVNIKTELEQFKNDAIVEDAKKSGKLEMASMVISLAHLLMCEVNNVLGEVEDMFRDMRLLKDDIVLAQEKYYKAADAYFREFGEIVEHNNLTMRMFEDIQDFDNLVKVWAKLKDTPKPESLMGGCKKACEQSLAKSRMCKGCKIAYNENTLICKACAESYKKGFEKGARWLENKRVERLKAKE